jgi:hypothetical protein
MIRKLFICPICRNKLSKCYENFSKEGLPFGNYDYFFKCYTCRERETHSYCWLNVNGILWAFSFEIWRETKYKAKDFGFEDNREKVVFT